jgi:hypothetical protein
VQTFGNRQTQRAVRVWARHVGASGDLASLATVDAPLGRGTVPWRSWTAGKWEAAATALGMPMDSAACVRMRSLTGRGRSSWHIVWGAGNPLGSPASAPPPPPFVYVFVPGELDRFVPLSGLRALAVPGAGGDESEEEEEEGGVAAAAPRVTFIWAEARTQLESLFRSNADMAAAAAASLGLPQGCPLPTLMAHPALVPVALAASLDSVDAAPAGAAASAPAVAPAAPRAVLLAASRARAAAAAAAPPGAAGSTPPAFGFEEDEDDAELDEEEARLREEAAAAAAERAVRAAADAEAAALAAEEAAAASMSARASDLWDPSASAWGGLSAAELLVEKGVAFGFLSLLERVRLIKGRAAASGFPIDNAVCSSWGRAAWDRAADEMGIVFFDAGWYAPLRRLPAGWHAAWCPDRGGWALYVASPSAAGARFFSIAALHALTAAAPPPGMPPWRDALDALRDASLAAPGLAKALDAELADLDAAAARARVDGAQGGARPPAAASATSSAPRVDVGAVSARLPMPLADGTAATAAASPAAAAAAAASASSAEMYEEAMASDKLPGLSPVQLYLQLGLGFAFMKLGSADAKRIVRAAAAAAKLPLSANAGWDKAEWAAASEQLQLQWLPEGTHSTSLPALGRGVRAAWGAGRVYIYAPAPVDRFMQTPVIKAGFCDFALRPPTAPRGEPFPAWSRTVDALAEAAASNPHLRAALMADAVFPKELLPPPEEEEPEEAADRGAVVRATATGSGDDRWDEEEAPDAMADFTDDDSIFAPTAPAPERARVNFAPNGMKVRCVACAAGLHTAPVHRRSSSPTHRACFCRSPSLRCSRSPGTSRCDSAAATLRPCSARRQHAFCA